MSYEIGKAALNLQWTERVAHTEYNDNAEIVRVLESRHPGQRFNDIINLDYLWTVHDGSVPWSERGRTTNMGHAVYVENGSDFKPLSASPFTSAEEVLNFHAAREYGLPDMHDLVQCYEQFYQDMRGWHPNQVISGGYYKTIVSGAIESFGWEMLLLGAGEDPEKFGEDVLGSFFELSRHHFTAWAQTSIEFFMCHDDMVWTAGPFMSPSFYRTYIFPRYKELFQVLHDAGKRVLYTSDGTFDMFLDDLVAAGVDGFCFEPTNDLEMMVRKVGKTHVLMGGADCRTLSFGTKADIEQELRWIFKMARDCPGFVFATGNHFPANIPLENALYYFELVEELGQRSGIPAAG